MTSSPKVDAVQVLLEAVSSRNAPRVVDIGCGGGALTKRLVEAGASVAGVDPSESALSAARRVAPDASFHCAGAEALPLEDGSCDFAIFLNSLHHVEPSAMDAALAEALRVLNPEGQLFVIEPLASGPLFEVLRLIDDETAIRQQAKDAVGSLIKAGAMRLVRFLSYERTDRYDNLDDLVERLTAVDPARRQPAERHREELARLFLEHSLPGERGDRLLIQPMIANILMAAREMTGGEAQ